MFREAVLPLDMTVVSNHRMLRRAFRSQLLSGLVSRGKGYREATQPASSVEVTCVKLEVSARCRCTDGRASLVRKAVVS
jgi:hypothetical protein